MRQWAATNAPGIDLDSETATFLDHARANGKTFKDWTAAWRTWMKRAVEFKRRDGRTNGSSPPSTADKIVALQQRMQARQAAGIS